MIFDYTKIPKLKQYIPIYVCRVSNELCQHNDSTNLVTNLTLEKIDMSKEHTKHVMLYGFRKGNNAIKATKYSQCLWDRFFK